MMTAHRVRILLAMFATGAVIGASIPQAHADPRVRILLAMFATGAVIGASIPQAHADPSTLVSTYAAGATNAVCTTLTTNPSFGGIEGVMKGIAEDGFTTNQSAEVVVIAVERGCPQFLGLLRNFADSAGHGVTA